MNNFFVELNLDDLEHDYVKLSVEGEDAYEINADLLNFIQDKKYLIQGEDSDNIYWKVFSDANSSKQWKNEQSRIQNVLQLLKYFETVKTAKTIQITGGTAFEGKPDEPVPNSEKAKYDCQFFIKRSFDDKWQKANVWYSNQMNCFGGGYFYATEYLPKSHYPDKIID